METGLGLFVGIGLSAACGFRVFVPLLIMSVATHAGHLTLAEGFEWIGSEAAIAAFAIATMLEVIAYYVPWVDNLLDTITTPAAIVAGTIMTASAVGDVSPFLRWSLAVIAGGGVAGTTQVISSLIRLASTATTGGLANPLVSTTELGGSVTISLASLVVAPLVAGAVLLVLISFGSRQVFRRIRQRQQIPSKGPV